MDMDNKKHLLIKHMGALIDPERLRRLAFESPDDDHTDHERELRVALQDALVLAQIYRDGRWVECTTDHGAIRYKDVTVHDEIDRLRSVGDAARRNCVTVKLTDAERAAWAAAAGDRPLSEWLRTLANAAAG